MLIGLYDVDMSKYTFVPFNLELMKLASYHKKRGDITKLCTSFSPNMYNRFICRKDYYDGDFSFVQNSNIEYGGRAFHQNKYVPLDLSIEKQKPDTYIYENFRKDFCVSHRQLNFYKNMLYGAHLRLSLDGKTIWDDFEKQLEYTQNTKTIFFHDYNLNDIENSDIIIKKLMKKIFNNEYHYLGIKFPIIVYNSEDFVKWLDFQMSSEFFGIQYKGIMEDEVVDEYVKKRVSRPMSTRLEYFILDGCKDEEDFIQNRLFQLFKQIIYLKQNRQWVRFRWDSNFFEDKRWGQLIQFFQSYLNAQVMTEKKEKGITLFKFIDILQDKPPACRDNHLNKDIVRELFQLVREKNYECFEAFYTCNTVELKGGEFVYD